MVCLRVQSEYALLPTKFIFSILALSPSSILKVRLTVVSETGVVSYFISGYCSPLSASRSRITSIT